MKRTDGKGWIMSGVTRLFDCFTTNESKKIDIFGIGIVWRVNERMSKCARESCEKYVIFFLSKKHLNSIIWTWCLTLYFTNNIEFFFFFVNQFVSISSFQSIGFFFITVDAATTAAHHFYRNSNGPVEVKEAAGLKRERKKNATAMKFDPNHTKPKLDERDFGVE